MQPKGTLDSTKVTDIEKRRSPSKHYVYVIEVQWSDGSLYTIGRRFSSFFDMHMTLLEKFPAEGGQKDPSKRTIPFLPGKNIFLRNSRDLTLKRLHSITEYCQALNVLPAHIAQCDILKRFFHANEDDISRYSKSRSTNETNGSSQPIQIITGPLEFESYLVIADYKAEDKTQVSLTAGEHVEVAEKNENGWWLVSNAYGCSGWVPGAYLENPDGKKEDLVTESSERGKGACYKATCAYEATTSDEISFPVGAVLEILQKNLEGWWLACYNGNEGWVPGSYLEKSEQKCPNEKETAEERDTVGNLFQFGQNGGGTGFRSKPRLPPKRSTIRRQVPKGGKTQNKVTKCCYVTLYDFTATIDGGLSFKEGQSAEVMEQSDNGWWLVDIRGQQGWAPASYLKLSSQANYTVPESSKTQRSPSPSLQVSSSPNRTRPVSSDFSVSNSSPARVRPLSTGTPFSPTPGLGRSPSPRLFPPTFNPSDSKPQESNKRPGRPVSPVFNKLGQPKNFAEGRKNLPRIPLDQSRQKQENNVSETWNAHVATETQRKWSDPSKNRTRNVSSESPLDQARSRFSKSTDEEQLERESWFRKISRENAEKALIRENKEGYFIVRPSSRKGTQNPYSITLFYRQSIFNFHIRKRSDGLYATGAYSEGEKTFRSVQEMIEFYGSNTLVVGDASNQVKLKGSPRI